MELNGKFYTQSRNRTPVYGEDTINVKGKWYREWDPKRSKLSAAMRKKLRAFPFNKGTSCLYLGASTGTTVSHLSDILEGGRIYAVEKAYEPFSKLLSLSEARKNIYPILEDAFRVERYSFFIDRPDVIYQDIAQRNQVQIFNQVSGNFKSIDHGLLVVKIRAISSRMKKEDILKSQIEKLENFRVDQVIPLEPYSIDNYMISVS
jgi:fibrillarin-like pre-rRNA processing protein